jgi:hypothetical protein
MDIKKYHRCNVKKLKIYRKHKNKEKRKRKEKTKK